MQKKANKLMRRYIVICVSIAVVLTVAISAFAEFTMSRRAKRVVASYGSSGDLFSSNILRSGTTIISQKYVPSLNPAQKDLQIPVTVCNYAQGNKMMTFSNDIEYTIKATLVTLEPETEVPVDELTVSVVNDDDSSAVTINKEAGPYYESTLSKELADMDRYIVTFDRSMIITAETVNPIYIKLEVTQELGGIPEKLSAYLALALRTGDAEPLWSGSFEEKMEDNGTPTDIDDWDGFNYVITGTGSTTLKISWNADRLKLNDISRIEELGVTGDPGAPTETSVDVDGVTWKSVTLNVNSADIITEWVDPVTGDKESRVETEGKPRYAIQFFRNTGYDGEGEALTWESLQACVTCETVVSPPSP